MSHFKYDTLKLPIGTQVFLSYEKCKQKAKLYFEYKTDFHTYIIKVKTCMLVIPSY